MLETVVLDDFSDLTLVVGTEDEDGDAETGSTGSVGSVQRVKVSSSVLRLASPVWKSMFNPSGHFLESTAKEVSFPDDDPTALLIVLRIAHLRFKEVPDKVSFKELVSVAVICDKYDTVSVVRPFLPRWTSSEMKISPGKEELIFIAWTFGYKDAFTSGVQELVRKVTIDDKGRCMFDGKAVNGCLPPDIIDCVLRARTEALSKLLEIPFGILERALSHNMCSLFNIDEKRSFPSLKLPHIEAVRCTTLLIGSIHRGLHSYGLGATHPEPSTLRTSAYALSNHIKSMWISVNGTRGDYRTKEQDHSKCNAEIDMFKATEKIMDSLPTGYGDHHLKHIAEQARK